ncbi:hypothetical protein CRUP_029417 [Coryphaenoides rupestris]|nr:hypothetical protein CRUP_029417 [Coryphaenoides rupestris]
MYTVPLERGSSESFRQREARAARLASEIEGSAQYRRRVSLENDDGKSEEDKYSAVTREREGRASPGFSAITREGRYIPLPQRAREMGMSPGSLRGGASARPGGPASSRHPAPNSSSPKPTGADRSSPLSHMYSVLPGGTRMLTSGAPPQAMGPAGPQYPGQADASQGQQQTMYGSQPPPQHAAPSPAHSQAGQGPPQAHALYHTGQLSGAPGHSSPQASFSMPGYSLPPHQSLPHSFTQISQLAQAHVAGGMTAHHHHPPAGHGPPPVMLHYGPPQHAASPAPQHPSTPQQQAAHQHFYMGPHQAVQVQGHPSQQLSFHPAGN